jgi:hypothetical protein
MADDANILQASARGKDEGGRVGLARRLSQQPRHPLEAAVPPTLMRRPKRWIGETALSQRDECARSIGPEFDDCVGVAGAAIGEVRTPSPTEGEPSGNVDLGENSAETVI